MNDRGLVRFTAWVSADAMLIGWIGIAATEIVSDRTASNLEGRQKGREIGAEHVSMEKVVILTALNVPIIQRGR